MFVIFFSVVSINHETFLFLFQIYDYVISCNKEVAKGVNMRFIV